MNPKEIVNQMFSNDSFSQWLDVQIEEVIKGRCVVSLQVSNLMTNGFKIAHGGIAYSLADSCAAFVANSFGFIAITKSSNIYYLKKVNKGDLSNIYSLITLDELPEFMDTYIQGERFGRVVVKIS